MPVQINEIIIRANIVEKPTAAESKTEATAGQGDKDEIVKACVEAVLEILRSKTER